MVSFLCIVQLQSNARVQQVSPIKPTFKADHWVILAPNKENTFVLELTSPAQLHLTLLHNIIVPE